MKKKNAFTVIELVIVIAVIGILSAILIPTFTTLIHNAQMASDISLVKNINTALSVDLTKHKTMHSALEVAKKNGISENNVKNLALSGEQFVAWDRINDRFVLVSKSTDTYFFPNSKEDENGVIENYYDYFAIYDRIPEEAKYSIYLSEEAKVKEATISVGFDAGNNNRLTSLTYDRSTASKKRDVVIRTNAGTSCTYNGFVNTSTGEGDSIFHYGEAGTQIIDCADTSFYEYGGAQKNIVNRGHYVQENGSIAAIVDASAETGNVNIELRKGSIQGTLKNTNETNTVTITSEPSVTTVSFEAKSDGGTLNVDLASQPTYSNTYDKEEISEEKNLVIRGVGDGVQGKEDKEAPASNIICPDGHNYILVAGYSVKVCSRCGAYEYTEPDVSEEEYEQVSIQQTYSENTYVITNSGNGVMADPVKHHEHNYGDVEDIVWTWEEYSQATAFFSCQDDDCYQTETVIVPTENGSLTNSITTNPTCTEEGVRTYVAHLSHHDIEFEDSKTEPVSALGHTPAGAVEENRVEPTCTEEGSYDNVIYCSVCHEELSRIQNVIPATGHNYEAVVTSPTCTKSGYTTYTCSECGHSYTDDEVAALGHDIIHHEAKNPTYESVGWYAYDTCSRCEYSTYEERPVLPLTKFVNNNQYLYRVGNQNKVALPSILYDANASIEITSVKNGANGVYNSGDKTIQFSGTGVVKITVNNKSELYLEVVDAYNATTATSATNKNVVLLNDISISGANSIEIDNGYAFYGNGFKINCTGDGVSNGNGGLGAGYIYISGNGLLDNAVVIAKDYAKAYMYANSTSFEYGVKEDENKVSDNHYAYQLSVVRTSDVATISNSYLYGARNNILAEGILNVDNVVLSNGSLSNIHFNSSEGSLNLHDVTTIQYKRTFNYQLENQTAKTADVIGVGILVGPAPDSGVTITSNPVLNISGYLKQYNWICSAYNTITSSKIAKSLINSATNQTQYQNTYQNTAYVNTGITYLNNASKTINDNRINHGYVASSISISGVSGQVYAPGANSTQVELKDDSYLYQPNKQGATLPTVTYSDVSEDKTFEKNKEFDYTFTANLGAGDSYSFNFNNLVVQIFGENTPYIIKDSSNNVVSNTSVLLNKANTIRYTLNISSLYYLDQSGNVINLDAAKQYNISLALVANITSLPEPEIISNPSGTYYKVTASNTTSSDWTIAAAPLDGLKISYWSTVQNKVVNLDLSAVLADAKTTNNNLTITKSDYTLALSSTAIKDKKTNIWVNASGKLYVTASSSDRVSSSTTSRTTTVTYTFSDNCGHTLTSFTKTFNSSKPASGDTLYSHNKLLDGELTTTFSSSGGGTCLLPNTLITLADGSQKMAKDLTTNDELLTYNHVTGQLETQKMIFNVYVKDCETYIINLYFDNGYELELASGHGLFNLTKNTYEIYYNYQFLDHIGEEFAVVNYINGEFVMNKATLVNVDIRFGLTDKYSPLSEYNTNCFADGLLTIPDDIEGMWDSFTYKENMMIDLEALQNDIETYGVYSYDDVCNVVPEYVFDVFNFQYWKAFILKGTLSYDKVNYWITTYVPDILKTQNINDFDWDNREYLSGNN